MVNCGKRIERNSRTLPDKKSRLRILRGGHKACGSLPEVIYLKYELELKLDCGRMNSDCGVAIERRLEATSKAQRAGVPLHAFYLGTSLNGAGRGGGASR
jgi:hypothetical protein